MRGSGIVIVGAGAAGLEAARELRDRGHTPLVLEARDRVGGRIFTRRDPNLHVPIELGAEFIHGEAPTTASLLSSAGLSSMEIRSEHSSAQRGTLKRTDYWSAVDRVLKRVRTEGPDESLASFLAGRPGGKRLTRDRRVTRRFVEGFHAADPKRLSAQSIATGSGESSSDSASRLGRVTQGYGALVAWLARDLGPSLRLGREVTTIAWRRGRVTVQARAASGRPGRYRARAVLVTVPIGVLRAGRHQAGGIEIQPEPPRLRRALEGLEAGAAVRVVLWFRELPWREPGGSPGFNFLHLSGGPFQVVWTADPFRCPLATAWCGGPAAAALSRLPRGEALRVLRSQLAIALGMSPRRLARAIRRVWWHDWNRDPHARGAYSYARAGARSASKLLTRPEEDTLFFAGEATDSRGGTVEAALASGRRAARQIDAALRAR
ncbi:MAG TPA: NAD(P)/FAD-dependent oxidoreductase [Candidatus Eisenbacteria bacterium]|nr:NAD(P)/FAD-dependent oxidoreductase [Candidatus Eisenbacteria bacterium]